MANELSVADIMHPYYDEKFRDWQKWRYCYEGGQRFIDNYLTKFSARESLDAFTRRKLMTYNPAFAKTAIEKIRNALFQRLAEVIRIGGSDNYTGAITGKNGGVDLVGSSMNSFIGRKILPELLTMSRVGIYVDMPVVSGITVADSVGKQPYIYTYRAEDIRSWALDESHNENEFTNILLRDYVYTYDDKTGLPAGLVSRFRRLWLEDGHVCVQFFNETGVATSFAGEEKPNEIMILNIPRIPFVMSQLSDSLLADVANYQIALLNIASSDIAYTLHSNFPFYTEQFNPRADSQYFRKPGQDTGGESVDGLAGKTEEVKVGMSTGRRYPSGLDRPGFIHPSSEPLLASMQKQEQLKAEIYQLVHLAVTNLQPTSMASAESKSSDNQGLEDGLSYIGLELENAERKIAAYWAMYENAKTRTASVFYPESYNLKTEEDRRKESDQLMKVAQAAPSKTYSKEVAKQLAKSVLGRKVSSEILAKIYKEIDDAPGITSDPLTIQADVLAGLCDLETGATLRGYPEGTIDAAKDDHADRLARISEAQSPAATPNGGPAARGNPDADGNPNSGKIEKQAAKETPESQAMETNQPKGSK